MTKPIDHETGSGNVFADLGYADAKEHQIKARLVQKISAVMQARGLTQVQAAEIIGMDQSDISKMLRGQFRRVSVDRLLQNLVALGQDVEIVVKPHRGATHAAELTVA